MGIFDNLGSFAGGLAGGIDQGLLIQQRRQEMEQRKQDQALQIATTFTSLLDSGKPAVLIKAQAEAMYRALGIDPKNNPAIQGFIKVLQATEDQDKVAVQQALAAAGANPDQIKQIITMTADLEQGLKIYGAMSDTIKKSRQEQVSTEAGRIVSSSGEESVAAKNYRKAGDLFTQNGMTAEAKAMYDQADALSGGDAAFTLGQGQTRFGPDGKPLASVAPAPPASTTINVGTQFDPATGKPMDTSADGGGGLTKPTQTAIEGDLLNLSTQAQQLKTIYESFRPEWQESGTRLKMAFAAGKEKLGMDIGANDRAALAAFSTYRSKASIFFTQLLKALSGAAVTPQEAERIGPSVPITGTGIFDGDSPTEFLTKIQQFQESVNLATARLYYIRRNGLDGSFIAQGREAPAGLRLDDMKAIMDARGDAIAADMAKQIPDIAPDQLSAAVLQQLSIEFGIAN